MAEAGPPLDLKQMLEDIAVERNKARTQVRDLEARISEANRRLVELEAAYDALKDAMKNRR
jgi:chromosome condensin MukBEF ATPase and DNA-binding subunit MukB